MNIALNPEAAADKSRESFRKTNGQFEVVILDAEFPEAARELAEKTVAPRALSKLHWRLLRDPMMLWVRAPRR